MPRLAAAKTSTARDERGRLRRRAVVFHETEPASPPRALEIDVGAIGQQQVEHRQVLGRARDRAAVEVADRCVDRGADFGMLLEQRADGVHVLRMQRRHEALDRVGAHSKILIHSP
jgi:hypothetical protein